MREGWLQGSRMLGPEAFAPDPARERMAIYDFAQAMKDMKA